MLIIGVDQPRPAAILEALIAAHAQGGSPITIPTYRGKRGHPPIFSTELLPNLMGISEEKQGLREVMARFRSQTREVETASPLVLADLNTEERYQQALELFASVGNQAWRS